jgi:hypothetical protein
MNLFEVKSMSRRLRSLFVDGIMFLVVLALTTILLTVMRDLSGRGDDDHVVSSFTDQLFNPNIWLYTYFLNKDLINGKSVGKTAADLGVVICGTMKPAGPLRCLVRNLCFILLPIEMIFLLYREDRRLGDFVAGTEVIVINEVQFNNVSEASGNRWLVYVVRLTIVVCTFLAMTYGASISAK